MRWADAPSCLQIGQETVFIGCGRYHKIFLVTFCLYSPHFEHSPEATKKPPASFNGLVALEACTLFICPPPGRGIQRAIQASQNNFPLFCFRNEMTLSSTVIDGFLREDSFN